MATAGRDRTDESKLVPCAGVLLGVCVALSLAGCGGGESQTAAPAPTPSTCSPPVAIPSDKLKKWSSFAVMDTHAHISDWSVIDYTYDRDSLSYRDWTQDLYFFDAKYAVFPMPADPASSKSCFFHIGLFGVRHDQQLLQSTWAQGEAQNFTTGPNMCGIVTTIQYEQDIKGNIDTFTDFLDKVEADVPLNVGFRCKFDTLQEEALPAFKELARRSKTFDFYVSAKNSSQSLEKLKSALWLAQKVPNLNIIIDHMGFTGVAGYRPPDLDKWRKVMQPLVGHKNVFIKVSGGAQGIDVMRPFFKACVEMFGFDRMLWSSNWYNINLQEGFYGYKSWAATIAQYLVEMKATDDDVRKLLYDTAAKVYKPPPALQSKNYI